MRVTTWHTHNDEAALNFMQWTFCIDAPWAATGLRLRGRGGGGGSVAPVVDEVERDEKARRVGNTLRDSLRLERHGGTSPFTALVS